MKIGILTQPLHHNYGGLLQNYALQQSMMTLGHTPMTIDWTTNCNWFGRAMKEIKTFVLSRKNVYKLTKNEKKEIYKNTDCFIEKHIIRTELVNCNKDFAKTSLKYHFDTYIVGSDQTWRPLYNPYLYAMFLNFTSNQDVKRIAYAASFGTDNWEYSGNQTSKCAKLLQKFDFISVREVTGVQFCKEKLGEEAKLVLDPTLLLDEKDYVKLIKHSSESHQSGLLYYILNPDKTPINNIYNLAKSSQLDCYSALPRYSDGNRTKDAVKNHLKECVYSSVEEWLNAFRNADIVITDSFHGMVFSIIFHKKFWVIDNKGRGNARFSSLLGLLKLNHRIVNDIKDLDQHLLSERIDWERVDSILSKEKKQSLDFLRSSLM